MKPKCVFRILFLRGIGDDSHLRRARCKAGSFLRHIFHFIGRDRNRCVTVKNAIVAAFLALGLFIAWAIGPHDGGVLFEKTFTYTSGDGEFHPDSGAKEIVLRLAPGKVTITEKF